MMERKMFGSRATKILSGCWAVSAGFWLMLSPAGPAQNEVPVRKPVEAMASSVEQGLAPSRQGVEKALADLRAVIASLTAEGKLVRTRQTYFGILQEQFRLEGPYRLPSAEAIALLPKATEVTEIISLDQACAALRAAVDRLYENMLAQREVIGRALVDELARTVGQAEKKEDLATAQKLCEIYRGLSRLDPQTVERILGRKNSVGDLTPEELGTYLEKMAAILTGLQQEDYWQAGEDLSLMARLGSLQFHGRPISSAPTLKTVTRAFMDGLRLKVRTALLATQAALERALMDRHPPEEIDKLLDQLSERQALLGKSGPFQPHDRSQTPVATASLETYYRMVARYLDTPLEIRSSPRYYFSLPNSFPAGEFKEGAEFEKFLTKLRSEQAAEGNAAATREYQRKQAANDRRRERKDGRQRVEESDQQDQPDRLAGVRETVRVRLAAANTVQNVEVLANDLPLLFLEDDESQDGHSSEWSDLQADLRGLVTWFFEPAFRTIPGSSPNVPAFYAAELGALRDRLLRDLVATHFSPEIKQAPLSTLPAIKAVRSLAVDAAGRSDWPKAYQLLSATVYLVRNPTEYAALTENLEAIKFYLSGRNLEAAGQFEPAAAAYRRALFQIGGISPAKKAGECLQALLNLHPSTAAVLSPSRAE